MPTPCMLQDARENTSSFDYTHHRHLVAFLSFPNQYDRLDAILFVQAPRYCAGSTRTFRGSKVRLVKSTNIHGTDEKFSTK